METAGGNNMVERNKDVVASKIDEVDIIDIPQEELNWSSVSLLEIVNSDARLEASVYNIEGRHAREILKKCKWELSSICGDNGLTTAYHRPRFKRVWVEKSPFPIYQPSQILELYPKPSGYISEVTKTNIETLRVKKGQILLTCSGTIGNCAIVSKTLDDKIFSHDLIRINCKEEVDIGYVYAFLRTKTGNTLINTNNYGAVVSHIEPEHLHNIPIPNPPSMLKKRIHELVMKSYELRDESNELLDKAEELLMNELELPPIDSLKLKFVNKSTELNFFTVKLSNLKSRLDASYHIPIVNEITEHLINKAELTNLGDKQVTEKIILAGIFKRVYVKERNGVPFLGGKEIQQLSPNPEKFLSLKHHKKRIDKELNVKENMVLITDRGTIGNIVFVPKHFEGFAVSQNVIKVKLTSEKIAGFAFVFLNSIYGKKLIMRHTYGSVIDMVDNNCVQNVEFPLLNNKCIQEEINNLALNANKKRYEAFKREQEAIRIVNDEVIHKS